MKSILFVLTSLFSFSFLHAQWYDPEKVSKKAGNVYAHAYEEAEEGKYQESIAHLEECIRMDAKFVDAYLSRAGIYANLKNYKASVTDFDKAFDLDSVYSKTYLLPYSISLAGLGEFDKALMRVNQFLETPRLNQQSIEAGLYRKKTFEFAVQYAKDHPVKDYVFTPKNLGPKINSENLEYYPSITIDSTRMVFNRRVGNDEDFYESERTDTGWTEAKPISGKINTNFSEGAQTLSQDGEWFIFAGCGYPEGEGSCDLYFCRKTRNGSWTEPENMGRLVNSEFWDTAPSLSPDKKDLYFVSSRPGGYGGKDIWVTHRGADGKWSRPENLGPTINTSGDEACSFMHADNQTLYFNSNGHEGYGMNDLFLSRKQGDGSWGKPVNLGFPLNTIDDEGSIIVFADGKTSVYASDGTENYGGLDLYSFELRPDIRPARTIWVKGKIFDANSKIGLPSSVELTDINNRNFVTHLQTDEDGNYLVTLPEGKAYAFNVNRKGYLFYSQNFDLNKGKTDSSFIVDIPLQPIAKGAHIVLKNIFYPTNKFQLETVSQVELDRTVEFMKENPKIKIQISGHTDNVGNEKDNIALSSNRAKAVADYLVSKGIAAARISSKGYGSSQSIAENNSEENRALNRRTELSIISVE